MVEYAVFSQVVMIGMVGEILGGGMSAYTGRYGYYRFVSHWVFVGAVAHFSAANYPNDSAVVVMFAFTAWSIGRIISGKYAEWQERRVQSRYRARLRAIADKYLNHEEVRRGTTS